MFQKLLFNKNVNIRRRKFSHRFFKTTILVLILFLVVQGGLFIAEPDHIVQAQSGTNLALGKAAVASSTQTSNIASRATDGLTSTAWSSTFAEPAWIYIDLGSPQAIQHHFPVGWRNAVRPSAGNANR